MSKMLSNVTTATLVVCAVAVAAAVVHREFFPASNPTALNPTTPRTVKNWEGLATTGHLMGSAAAPIRIVEFSDFECPYCRAEYFTLDSLLRQYDSTVAVVFRHFPLEIHPNALTAAYAAECAGAQGRFRAFSDILFQHQTTIGLQSWGKFAVMAGISDTAAFTKCLMGQHGEAAVARDVAAARSIGASGTPTLVIRDRRVSVALPLDSLKEWVSSEQRRLAGR